MGTLSKADPVAFQAQETAAPANTAKPKHSEITVTGCLQKGDSADEFAITGENGKTWQLRSGTVKLAEHVGHTVTIAGMRHHETKAEEAVCGSDFRNLLGRVDRTAVFSGH